MHGVQKPDDIRIPERTIIRLDRYQRVNICECIFVHIISYTPISATTGIIGDPLYIKDNATRETSSSIGTSQHNDTSLSIGFIQQFLDYAFDMEAIVQIDKEPTLRVVSVEQLPEFGAVCAVGVPVYASTRLVVSDGRDTVNAISIEPMPVQEGDIIRIRGYGCDHLWMGNGYDNPPALSISAYDVVGTVGTVSGKRTSDHLDSRRVKRQRCSIPHERDFRNSHGEPSTHTNQEEEEEEEADENFSDTSERNLQGLTQTVTLRETGMIFSSTYLVNIYCSN